MSWIPLTERVPGNYHRLFMFFGENDFKAIICVDGEQRIFAGECGKATPQSSSDCMDWRAYTVAKIRAELRAIEMFPGIDLI